MNDAWAGMDRLLRMQANGGLAFSLLFLVFGVIALSLGETYAVAVCLPMSMLWGAAGSLASFTRTALATLAGRVAKLEAQQGTPAG